jgi:large conductance mechanosensitive channel
MEKAKQKTRKLRGVARNQAIGFLDFIRGYGVVSLAIGIVIGSAVTNLVNALVVSLINPLVGIFLPGSNLARATFTIGGSTFAWGAFVSALINFIIIAAVVYFGVKGLGLDKIDKKGPLKK